MSTLQHHVLTSFPLCNRTDYPIQPNAVISKAQSREQSPVPLHLHPPILHKNKNKVKSKITRKETRVNKCRKTPTSAGLSQRFVLSANAMTGQTVRWKRTNINAVLLFFFSQIACNVNTHHGGASLNGCCHCLT